MRTIEQEQEPVSDSEFTMFTVGGKAAVHPIRATIGVNGKQTMEVDTGAAVSVISSSTVSEMPVEQDYNNPDDLYW